MTLKVFSSLDDDSMTLLSCPDVLGGVCHRGGAQSHGHPHRRAEGEGRPEQLEKGVRIYVGNLAHQFSSRKRKSEKLKK